MILCHYENLDKQLKNELKKTPAKRRGNGLHYESVNPITNVSIN